MHDDMSLDAQYGRALDNASVSSILNVALVAAKAYDAIEHPDEPGSMQAAAVWFPKLRGALEAAGLLRVRP